MGFGGADGAWQKVPRGQRDPSCGGGAILPQGAITRSVLYLFREVASEFIIFPALGYVRFEKLTNYEYEGETYDYKQNLTLKQCQEACIQDANCKAASFSFFSPYRNQTENNNNNNNNTNNNNNNNNNNSKFFLQQVNLS